MEREQDIELLVETSPNGNMTATVEQNDRVAHMYLHGEPDIEFGVKSCWVRNLQQAPEDLDLDGMADPSGAPVNHATAPGMELKGPTWDPGFRWVLCLNKRRLHVSRIGLPGVR